MTAALDAAVSVPVLAASAVATSVPKASTPMILRDILHLLAAAAAAPGYE
jgi:hypothetical protein